MPDKKRVTELEALMKGTAAEIEKKAGLGPIKFIEVRFEDAALHFEGGAGRADLPPDPVEETVDADAGTDA